MPQISIYNAIEGSSSLLEYLGSPGDIIVVTPFVVLLDRNSLANMKLNLIKGNPLTPIKDFTFFSTDLTVILLTIPQVIEANINGVAHMVIPSDGVPAMASIIVEVEVLNLK